MAVISTPNASSIKIKFDHGVDLNGDRIIKTKTLNQIKPDSSSFNCAPNNSIFGSKPIYGKISTVLAVNVAVTGRSNAWRCWH